MINLFKIPNLLTLTRIFVTPILVSFLLTSGEENEIYGVILFLAASSTDFLDGYIARKRKEETVLGKLLDPLADKLLTCAVFIALVELRLAPAWLVYMIISREIIVTGIRAKALQKGIIITASTLGKIKTFAQVLCITLLILGKKYLGDYFLLGKIFLWMVLILAIWSGLAYIINFINSNAKKIKVKEKGVSNEITGNILS